MLISSLIVVASAGVGVGLWTLGIIGSSVSDALDPDLPHVGWRNLADHVAVRLRRARTGILVLVPLGSVLGFTCAALVLLGTGMGSGIAPDAAAFGAPLGTVVAPVVYFRWLLGRRVSDVARVAGTAAAGTVAGGLLGGAAGQVPGAAVAALLGLLISCAAAVRLVLRDAEPVAAGDARPGIAPE